MVDPGCSPGAERSPGAASTITDGSLSLADLAGELVCEEEHSSRRDRAETGESLPDWLRNAEGALKGTDDAGSDGSSQGELPEWLRDAAINTRLGLKAGTTLDEAKRTYKRLARLASAPNASGRAAVFEPRRLALNAVS